MLQIPLRTKKLYYDAIDLQKRGFYLASLLYFNAYLEQFLLFQFLCKTRDRNPIYAKKVHDDIINIKDKGNLTFGKILEIIKINNKSKIYQLIKEIKQIRNDLVAHTHFVTLLDKNNKYKLAFYDVNNYRKIVGKLYKHIKSENILDKDTRKINNFLKVGHPLSKIRFIEIEGYEIEQIILSHICKKVNKNIDDIIKHLSGKLI